MVLLRMFFYFKSHFSEFRIINTTCLISAGVVRACDLLLYYADDNIITNLLLTLYSSHNCFLSNCFICLPCCINTIRPNISHNIGIPSTEHVYEISTIRTQVFSSDHSHSHSHSFDRQPNFSSSTPDKRMSFSSLFYPSHSSSSSIFMVIFTYTSHYLLLSFFLFSFHSSTWLFSSRRKILLTYLLLLLYLYCIP
uniref:Uncharacterized protein n=1 Tax=Cacopsylla melanoneura TaxID=428564 RepID=A0A8D9F998_9HEMI